MQLICIPNFNMDNFIVSARKYRPTTFDDVVGQAHITDTLLHEIESNKLAQAFLFTGPRGVGKTTCARILAKVINQRVDGTDPNQDFAFNIFELDAASNNSVEDIRQLIDQVRIPPQVGKYKVYIIDEVHMLSSAAFNAFLKTLEEPPAYAIFILATTEKHKILPTILSRCQVFNFNRIEIKDMTKHLQGIANKESVSAEEDALHLIAKKADGGLRDALSIFDQLVSFSGGNITYAKAIEILNVLDADVYFKQMQSILVGDVASVLVSLDEIIRRGFDGQHFLSGLSGHVRDLILCKDSKTERLLDVSAQFEQRYKDQSAQFTYSFLLNALNLLNECDEKYKTSRHPRLLLELTLMKLAHLDGFIKNLLDAEELKKKFHNSPEKDLEKSAVSKPEKAAQVIHTDKIAATRIPNIAVPKLADEDKNKLAESQAVQTHNEIEFQNTINSSSTVEIKTTEELKVFDLEKIWQGFAANQGGRIGGFLKTVEKRLEGSKLILTARGTAYLGLEEIKIPLSSYLKENSAGNITEIEIVKGESQLEESLVPYTNKEKLEAMLKEHPELANMIQALDLFAG